MLKPVLASISLLAGLAFAPVTHAAFPSLPGAKPAEGAAKADPAAIEQDLKSIVITTTRSLEALNLALGNKEEADKLAKSADCLDKGSCGVADGVATLNSGSEATAKHVADQKAKGVKLDKDAAAMATKGILPGLTALPLWKRVIDGGKALSQDRMAMMKAAGLMQTLPKVPPAARSSVDFVKATIDYMSFSGQDTTEVSNALSKGMQASGIS